MNRKQRNEQNKFFYIFNSYIPELFLTFFCGKKKNSVVDRNRKAARLRRLYHRRADWICPAYNQNPFVCERCKYKKRCMAISINDLIFKKGLTYVPRSRAVALQENVLRFNEGCK